MYKQWHTSVSATLKVCTSATAHTQNVSVHAKTNNMVGIKLSVFGIVLFGIGYLSYPEHVKKGVGYFAYLLSGFVIFLLSFIPFILLILGIELAFKGLFVKSTDVTEIAVFYRLIPDYWFPNVNGAVTQLEIKHLILLLLFVLSNAMIIIILYKIRKNIIKVVLNKFVIGKIENVLVAGRMHKFKLGKDETGQAFRMFERYHKIDDKWNEIRTVSIIEFDRILEDFENEEEFRIKYHESIVPDPQAVVKSVNVSLIQKKGKIIVNVIDEEMISLSASNLFYYGYCELKGIQKNSELTIESTLSSKPLKKLIQDELVKDWKIPLGFYELEKDIISLKGAHIGNDWEIINQRDENFNDISKRLKDSKESFGVYPILEDDDVFIYAKITTYRCLEIRLLWNNVNITKKILQDE